MTKRIASDYIVGNVPRVHEFNSSWYDRAHYYVSAYRTRHNEAGVRYSTPFAKGSKPCSKPTASVMYRIKVTPKAHLIKRGRNYLALENPRGHT